MFLLFMVFLSLLVFTTAGNEDRRLDEVENLLRQQYELILKLQMKVAQLETNGNTNPPRTVPYNTTVEELEVRVERLEEDMFLVQDDVNELQYTVQETIETVMDHTDNLNQLSDDLSNVQTSIDEIEDRTTAAETNIILLESEINVLDARASDIEQILYETKNSAFYATLSANVVFETDSQTIVFDNDKINEGGHYNVTTGVYTTPVSGIYQFFAYIRSRPKANFHIRVDGSIYVNTIENYDGEAEGGDGEADGASVIVQLQAGQTVYVTTGDEPHTVDGDTNGVFTWFGGYLLFPDAE